MGGKKGKLLKGQVCMSGFLVKPEVLEFCNRYKKTIDAWKGAVQSMIDDGVKELQESLELCRRSVLPDVATT